MIEFTQDEIILAGLNGRGGMNRQTSTETGASLVRKQFLERVPLLPEHIQKALREGKAQISDAPYYSTEAIQGTRAELIKLASPEKLGITNIDNGKLGKDRYLVLSGLVLLYDKTSIDGRFTDDFPTALLNGEWEFEMSGKKLFEKQPIRRFFDGYYGYNVNKPFGLYMFDSTKTIEPQSPIEFNVSLPAAVPGFLKVFTIGIAVYGY